MDNLALNIQAAAFQLAASQAFKMPAQDVKHGDIVYVLDDYNTAVVMDVDDDGVHVVAIDNDYDREADRTVHKATDRTYQLSWVRPCEVCWPHFE